MPRTRSQTKTITNIDRLPFEILFNIIKRLPIKNKFLLKAVCKKWRNFVIFRILPNQHKLSIRQAYFSAYRCSAYRCIDPDHQFKFGDDNNTVPLRVVRADRKRKRFFEKEVTGVKVLRLCGGTDENGLRKYCLSEGPSSSLQCLRIGPLEKPLVKVLPNLQHFSADSINLVSLISVLQYCPVLTHLSINTREFSDDFVDTFMNLPKGLQYLKLGGGLSDILAVLCSPAMETLESLLLEKYSNSKPFNKLDARVKPAPRLEKFSISVHIWGKQDRRMVVDFLKECPALKKIFLAVPGLTLENQVNIYSRLSNLEMIKLDLYFEFDDVIPMIVERNRNSLKYLQIGQFLLNLESIKKLAEFPNLQTLSLCSSLVRILVLTDRICVNFVPLFLQPSNEQLLAFAQTRLNVCKSPLLMKSKYWTDNHFLDPLGPACRDANIQLVSYE